MIDSVDNERGAQFHRRLNSVGLCNPIVIIGAVGSPQRAKGQGQKRVGGILGGECRYPHTTCSLVLRSGPLEAAEVAEEEREGGSNFGAGTRSGLGSATGSTSRER